MMNSKLQQAILSCLDDEIAEYEILAATTRTPILSGYYLRRKKDIINSAEARKLRGHNFKGEATRAQSVPFRKLFVLVAIFLLVLASGVTAAAVVKHYIMYTVDKEIASWRITFENSQAEFPLHFEPIEPPTPDGFYTSESVSENDSLWIRFENDNGVFIEYTQSIPIGSSLNVDNERHKNRVEKINDTNVITSRSKEGNGIIFNDGQYFFTLYTNGDLEILRQLASKIIANTNIN